MHLCVCVCVSVDRKFLLCGGWGLEISALILVELKENLAPAPLNMLGSWCTGMRSKGYGSQNVSGILIELLNQPNLII